MASVLELDRQTASFVRQLEEQRNLEKSLLVERVRGTKEWQESTFGDIKSRVEVLEKLNGSAGTCSSLPSGQCLVVSPNATSSTVAARVTLGCAVESANDFSRVEEHGVETSIGRVAIVVVAHVG